MREVTIEQLVSAVSKSLARGRFVSFDYIKPCGEQNRYVHGAIPKSERDFKSGEEKPLFDAESGNFTVWCVTRKGFRSFKKDRLVTATIEGEKVYLA